MALEEYLITTIGSVVTCYLLGLYGQSCVWVLVLVGVSALKTHMWRKRQKRIMALQAAAIREREVVMAQFQDLPAWVNFPDTERVEWLNKVVLQLWPYVGEYGKNFIQEFVVPQVKTQMPSMFRSFKFTKMDMGDIPCRVGGIKVYTQNVGRDRIIIDMDVAYAGDCDFTISVAGFTGGMNQLQFSGKLRVILKPLLPYPPMIGGISAYFLEPPKIDFNLTGVGEMVELPGLISTIRSILNTQVCNICVLPNEVFVPLVPDIDATQLYFSEPDGVIRLKIIEAKDLENRDISFIRKGLSDPYCEIQVGAQYFKTRTINNNLNPVWNECFEAIVDAVDVQKLRLELFDKDPASKDEELGRLVLPIDMIKRTGTINKWYQLEGCEHGDIHLKASWFDLSKEKDDLERSVVESDWLSADKPVHPAILMVFIDNVSELPYPKAKLEPSPYVEVTVGNNSMRTPIKEKTVNPLYNSRFIFFVRDPMEQELKIQAFDNTTGRLLGKLNLHLERLFSETDLQVYQRTFILSQGVHQSFIVLTMKLLFICFLTINCLIIMLFIKDLIVLLFHAFLLCRELRPVDKSGLADPYISVSLVALDGSQPVQKKRTGIVKKSLKPIFDNQFEFDMHSGDIHNYKILLKVKDSTNYGVFVKPPVLGIAEIRLDNYDYAKALENYWLNLDSPSRS
uniref:Extended synaptotagmin-2 n=1 Tax=Syphacia muris TaxID=451379 RepID=A0A158R441_9BILA